MAVKRAVAETRRMPTSMLESPEKEPKCNGNKERAV